MSNAQWKYGKQKVKRQKNKWHDRIRQHVTPFWNILEEKWGKFKLDTGDPKMQGLSCQGLFILTEKEPKIPMIQKY